MLLAKVDNFLLAKVDFYVNTTGISKIGGNVRSSRVLLVLEPGRNFIKEEELNVKKNVFFVPAKDFNYRGTGARGQVKGNLKTQLPQLFCNCSMFCRHLVNGYYDDLMRFNQS